MLERRRAGGAPTARSHRPRPGGPPPRRCVDPAPSDRPAEARPGSGARSWVATALGVAALAVVLPGIVAGTTRLVIVRGESMAPTYRSGDVLLATATGPPEVGDVVVVEVPDGAAAGRLVVHRVAERRADGTFTTRGGGRTSDDAWSLTDDDVRGRPRAHVPGSGALLDALRRPWALGALAGGLVTILLWPSSSDGAQRERSTSASASGSSP